jgi:hypothetical protein
MAFWQDVEQFIPFIKPIFDGLRSARDLFRRDRPEKLSKPTASPVMTEGIGGKGGDATVGGSGIAIGGLGGRAGKYGTGGAGGSAEVHGDGLAAGGTGGAAGEDGVWRPPAKSGYEIAQRKLGLPVDPFLRQFGRGGAAAGYEPKLRIIEQLRATYLVNHKKNRRLSLKISMLFR